MLKRDQVKEVLTALVRTGWMMPRHVDEATNDVVKSLEELEADKGGRIKQLVDNYPWHGSYFPWRECFNELKTHVPADKHAELEQAIRARAKEHDDSLE